VVILFKKFDDGRAVYEGDISKEQMLEFIQRYAVPLVRYPCKLGPTFYVRNLRMFVIS
jgi:hypothetical protein